MTRLTKAQQRRREIAIKAGRARMQQLRDSGQLSEFQRHAGKNGAKATMDKYGKATMVEKVANYRRSHPSSLEVTVHEMLGMLGVKVLDSEYNADMAPSPEHAYTEHIPFPGDNDRAYILDVAWPQLRIALEIDGNVHLVFDTPEKQVYHVRRDICMSDAGWKVFRLAQNDLHTDYGANVLAECVALVRETAGCVPTENDRSKTRSPEVTFWQNFDDEVPY